ncbi:gamma-glutamyltransferase [Leptolyngbya sp. NIES-2104]|uniref:gamma-glutamyltransferase n=1 Tax=Leptolyngbya sp. NIES-2104 TaxID=1552121 RepID=UPI00192D14F4|nr:gamma-glutamyltransferase [Leptolyngbya sp. NIES-2104]
MLGLVFGSTGLGFALAIDLLLAKTNYSLTLLYQAASAGICVRSPAPSCGSTATPTPPTAKLGTTGMVVSEQREATQAGIDILNQGGNAIDAAVGVGYALAATYPCCGNLGGGGFMLIRFADGRSRFVDFREIAPGAATPTVYLDAQGKVIKGLSTKGYLAVGVPGTVKGLDYALATYGSRDRKQVMALAITLAEQGFVLQSADAELLQGFTQTFKAQPNVAAIFLKNGKPYQSGERLVQSNLARSTQ